jgi:hypothetical protein
MTHVHLNDIKTDFVGQHRFDTLLGMDALRYMFKGSKSRAHQGMGSNNQHKQLS